MSDKMKDVALSSQQSEQRVIPFGKAVRVGNYKLWRSKKAVGIRSSKFDLEQINVSTLDGDWQVKIPATYEMFAAIHGLYAQGNQEARLSTIFGNMMYASIVANGYFHHAINIVATIYANPNLLDENDEQHEMLMNNVKSLIKGFVEWRKEYDKRMSANEPTEDEMKNEQVAEEILDELKKKE